MDSPESSKPTNTTCETSPAQDSPVFSYISNLSPIQLLKAPSVTPGFPGLNSPPLVFTSPRLNPQSQPKIFKSAQFPRPFIAKFPGQFEDCKNSLTTGKGVENLDIQRRNRLFACGEKGSYTISNVNDLIQSPSGHSEQFLTDIVNVESVDADFSVDSIKKSEHDDQVPDDVSRSKKVPVNNDQVHNSKTIEEIAVVSKQTGQVHRENTPVNLDEAEKDIKEKHWFPDDHIPVTGNEFTLNNDFPHQPDDSLTVIENIGAGQDASFEQSFHLLSRPSEIGVEKEDFVEANETILTAAVLNEVQGDLKAIQHRGAHRRCLQFEDAQHKLISIQLAQNPSDSEKSKSPLTPTNGDHNDVLQLMHHRNSLNSLTKNPTCSGIGLHLNSFVNTVQAGSGAAIYGKAAQDESVLAPLDEVMHESDVSVAADLAALATLVKPPNDPVVLNSKTHQSTTCNKRKSTEISGGLEDITNLEPKNNRMKLLNSSSGDGDGNGCKRCNCKRSKCLKLYCDCFAAGIYCAEPCSCQECFNRPEYEDKVLETRQKIESRDPFAFAPRVVQGIIEQPASNYGEDGARFTPASARHKKGCKCKKSMCLKKYCECYQSNVGCSDVCRCEGCKNIYGQKGGYGITNAVLTGEDTNETTELVNPHTPAVQFSNCGKDASKALLSSGKYIQSPGSSFIYEEQHVTSPGFTQISDDNVMIPETSMDFLDLRSLGQESLHGNSDGMMNKFSEVRNQSGKIGPSFGLPNLRKWPYTTSKAQSFSANKNDFSGTSLIWRGSPITPMTQFNRNKVLPEAEFGFDLLDIMPDGTPDMLKDTYTPLNTVKVSSPNKKRVSPPHGRPPHQLDSSSSAGIRTGRKFLLRAVPSFPPLTPCIGSKKPDVEQADNPDNRSSNR